MLWLGKFFLLLVKSWCQSRRLKHLGVPMFLGSGLHEHESSKLRFLVLERFGKDVDELFLNSKRRFDVTTVLMLGLRVVSSSIYLRVCFFFVLCLPLNMWFLILFLYHRSMMIHACIKFTLVLYNRVSLKLFFLFFF